MPHAAQEHVEDLPQRRPGPAQHEPRGRVLPDPVPPALRPRRPRHDPCHCLLSVITIIDTAVITIIDVVGGSPGEEETG